MLSELLIRPSRIDDGPSISEMMQQSYGRLLTNDYNPRILAKALPRISKARPELLNLGTYFVAETAKGEIIAAGGWTDVSPTNGLGAMGEGHIRHLAVHPDWTRQGIAQALIDESFQSARDMGVRSLRCFSTLSAEPFYLAMGFCSMQEIELSLEPGLYFPAVEMRKTLH